MSVDPISSTSVDPAAGSDPISKYLVQKLSAATQKLLREYNSGPNLPLEQALVADLNQILKNQQLYDDHLFTGVALSPAAKRLAVKPPKGDELAELNRMLLLAAYPRELSAEVTNWIVTLHGANFQADSDVYIDGKALEGEGSVAFVSSNMLRVKLEGADYKAGSSHSVVVHSPNSDNGSTDAIEIVLPRSASVTEYPPPGIQEAKAAAVLDAASQFLTGWKVALHGSSFRPDSIVSVGEKPLPDTASVKFVDAATLSFDLSGTEHKPGDELSIAVRNPDPNGGSSEEAKLTLPSPVGTVSAIAQIPQVQAAKVDPVLDAAGNADGWLVTLTGASFRADAKMYLDKHALPNDEKVVFVDAGKLTVSLSKANHKPGVISVLVVNPEPNGGLSDSVTVTLT